MPLELISIDREIIQDEDPDFSYLEQDYKDCTESEAILYKAQAKKRLDALMNGQWTFIGIQAKAEIRINGIFQTISSGGLWGIEDDSGEEYFQEIYEEQKEELKTMLLEMGFKKEELV